MQEHCIPVPLGIAGFRVIDCVQGELGLEVDVETDAAGGLCPECGAAALVPKERPVVLVRDVPIRGLATWLRWRKRRYACPACARSFTETHAEVPVRARMPRRYERYLYLQVAAGSSISRVAREEVVSFYRVQRAFSEGARDVLEQRSSVTPRLIGIDEASHRRGLIFNTVVTDPQARDVLEVVEGRDGKALQAWLLALPEETRLGIEAVSVDMWAPYLKVVRRTLPHAIVVCDKFHIVRTTGKALDGVRRRLQRREGHSRRTSGWQPSLFRLRHALLADPTRLRPKQWTALASALQAYPELATAYRLYQDLRRLYAEATSDTAPALLARFYQDVERSELLEFRGLVNGAFRIWEHEILAYFTVRITNAYAEGITNKIKVIKRTGYGYRNFARFRERVLVQCGAA